LALGGSEAHVGVLATSASLEKDETLLWLMVLRGLFKLGVIVLKKILKRLSHSSLAAMTFFRDFSASWMLNVITSASDVIVEEAVWELMFLLFFPAALASKFSPVFSRPLLSLFCLHRAQ
jgi:hypothetical protein